jgi:NodT family efflux transporter outer membrane factor (OMF) lipoprotein
LAIDADGFLSQRFEVLNLKRSLLLSSASAAVLLLAGCAVGPDFERPAPPATTGYTAQPLPASTASGSAEIAGGAAQQFNAGMDVAGQWWTLFEFDPLNELVALALEANPDLEAAEAALNRVRENYLAAHGPLFPALGVNGSAQRQQSPQTSNMQLNNSLLNLYNVSVGVSYVLDVFSGTRRAVEAAGAQVDNQRYQLEATYLTVISNVLTSAIQEATLAAQIEAVEEIIAVQTQALDLMTQQFELGAVARGDVLAQQSQLNQTQADLPEFQKQLAQVRTQLTILLGRYPAENAPPGVTLLDLSLPQELPLSLPSELVNQRPDVRIAEALLHQASANIGVATANMLPQFTLSGNYGTNSTSIPATAALFGTGTTGWSLSAGMAAPIFQGGQLSRQRQAALYGFEVAEAQYRSTVLAAFANVADVLNALRFDAEVLRAQEVAADTAAQSLEITTERFRAGAIAYLPLLDAQRTYQQARISLAQSQGARFADTVALFQALGGGWWNRPEIVTATRPNPLPIP